MKKRYYVFAILGFAVFAAGLLLVKTAGESNIAPYLCIGFGSGIFGHGVGEILSRRAAKKAPEAARQREIEENDERNVALRDKAQAKAYNIMLPVFGALFIAFALMGVELRVVLLLIAAYIFVCASSIYNRIKLEREM